MFKKLSLMVSIALVVFVISSIVFSTVSAQESTLNPDTVVSKLDGIMGMPEATTASTVSSHFTGTGELAPESERMAGPNSFAAPIQGFGTESIIGADGRKRVNGTTTYPNRAIVYLLMTFPDSAQGSCTGWFIGPRTVATAGHCVYSHSNGGWASSIQVFPGRNGLSTPYGSTVAWNMFTVTGWVNDAKPAYDYGAIQTDDDLGNVVGWFGYAWQRSNIFPGNYKVRGYPGDKPDGTMWTMTGLITATSTKRLWYNMDTYPGQSGSPVYGLYSNQCCYGYAIHNYGVGVGGYPWNSGSRITSAVFNSLNYWRNFPYP